MGRVLEVLLRVLLLVRVLLEVLLLEVGAVL